ncbi:sensor histidine kinase [bacterium]|nr:sensor histidine kinase [bacterium]
MKSIKIRILLIFLLPSIFMILTQWYFINIFIKDTLEKQLIKFITHVGESAIRDISPGEMQVFPNYPETETYKNLRERLSGYRDNFDIDNILLLNSDKRVILDLSDMFRNGEEFLMMDINDKQFLALKNGQIKKSSLYKNMQNIYSENVYIPIIGKNGDLRGVLVLYASVKYFTSIMNFQRKLISFFLAMIIILIFVVYWLASTISNPVIRLSKVVDRIGMGEMDIHVPYKTRADEVGHLAENIQSMMTKIENRDMYMRQMSAGIAHEIRNPLTSIKGNLMLIKRRVDNDDDTMEMLEDNLREVNALENLVNDFMNYAKSIKIELKTGELSDIISRAVGETMPFMQQKEIVLSQDISTCVLAADQDHLKRAFVNIIKNSIDAVPIGGKIRISSTLKDGRVRVSFKDSGEGIPKDDLTQIFEPFVTSRSTGTGLGLTIVKEIIEKHKGNIKIASAEGKGTEVTVSLPFRR